METYLISQILFFKKKDKPHQSTRRSYKGEKLFGNMTYGNS